MIDKAIRTRIRELLAERGETPYAVSKRERKHATWLTNLLGREDRSWRLVTLQSVASALDCDLEVKIIPR